ncbi:tetratricopeptide repeat protein [Salsuginibacillus kocurii]|uniref:tetratricopeptide repeat protein n=1 Tax=Salsuginibacillus kocurii TaxID=427078 RepID=UPI0003645C60|nr:tetratricopeptide repeat protein [Salsuginibacillus kocurii]
MNEELEKAIDLRTRGNHKESSDLLMRLVEEFPEDALINYQCAWSLDILGEEAKAVPFYESAIKFGLPKEDLEEALVGLGSTYRTLGEYDKSKHTLQKGMEVFPNNRAIQTFYAMTLYNLNEHNKAMELLLKCLTATTTDSEIYSYKQAIEFYADKLDEVWK